MQVGSVSEFAIYFPSGRVWDNGGSGFCAGSLFFLQDMMVMAMVKNPKRARVILFRFMLIM